VGCAGAWRTLASGDLSGAYATGDWGFPGGGFSSRSLSSRLSNRRLGRFVETSRFANGRCSLDGHGGPRVVGSLCVLDHRALISSLSRAAAERISYEHTACHP